MVKNERFDQSIQVMDRVDDWCYSFTRGLTRENPCLCNLFSGLDDFWNILVVKGNTFLGDF